MPSVRRSAVFDVALTWSTEWSPPVDRKDLSRNLMINVVNDGGGEITVGGVAEQLGVDPSVASRMVSDLVVHGYVERGAYQHDGRRTVLQLTPDGVALRDRYRHQHRQAFEHITRDRAPRERRELARLLIKYVEAVDQR